MIDDEIKIIRLEMNVRVLYRSLKKHIKLVDSLEKRIKELEDKDKMIFTISGRQI